VPPHTHDDFDVDVQFTRFIRRARLRTMHALAQISSDLDYSSYLFLSTIHDARDGVRASELADAFDVHKSTVSRSVATLEKLGLVVREPDPEDGRAQLLTATPEAAERLRRFRAESSAWFAGLLEGWTADEQATLARMIRRLNETPDPA